MLGKPQSDIYMLSTPNVSQYIFPATVTTLAQKCSQRI